MKSMKPQAYRVLIVEDDPVFHERIKDALATDLGYTVFSAFSYPEAIKLLDRAQDPFDLVTVDLHLSGKDRKGDDFEMSTQRSKYSGVGIVKHIYNQHRNEVCIIVSGGSFQVGQSLESEFKESNRIVAKMYPKSGMERLNRQIIQLEFPRIIQTHRRRYQKIFCSYRRAHTDIAARIYDRLTDTFLPSNIFFDFHSIRAGHNFKNEIKDYIDKSDIMLVIIGQDWLTMEEDGIRRLDNPNDWVRYEIAEALRSGLRVIPVLTHGTSMPTAASLPDDLKQLSYCHAVDIRSNHHFADDVSHLIGELLT